MTKVPQPHSSSRGEKLNQDKQMLVFQFILVALFFLLVSLIFIIEPHKETKHQFFSGNDNTGYEPAFVTVSVADGTAFSVGIFCWKIQQNISPLKVIIIIIIVIIITIIMKSKVEQIFVLYSMSCLSSIFFYCLLCCTWNLWNNAWRLFCMESVWSPCLIFWAQLYFAL